jgi:hypothetical protein
MKHAAFADAVGVVILSSVAALPFGCVPRPTVAKADLQPLIAVAGTYELMVSGPKPNPTPAPAPAPKPNGCLEGCRCNGTGIEPTGDDLSKVPCRCEDDCPCKTKRCETGKCPPPTQRTVR